MNTFRRVFVAGFATLLLAGACTSINIPSIPPIPTIPPGFTIPPIPNFSFPPITIPSGDANSAVCQLISAAEMSTILGAQVTVSGDDADSCTYTLPTFATVVVTVSNETDLSGVQFLMGQSAQQTTIAGSPAIAGTVLGQPAVYVQKGGTQLQVLGVLLGSDQAQIDKMVQVANTVVPRLP